MRVREEPWGFLELQQKQLKLFSISLLQIWPRGNIWSKELGAQRKAFCDLHPELQVKLECDDMSPVNCIGKNPFLRLLETEFCLKQTSAMVHMLTRQHFVPSPYRHEERHFLDFEKCFQS